MVSMTMTHCLYSKVEEINSEIELLLKLKNMYKKQREELEKIMNDNVKSKIFSELDLDNMNLTHYKLEMKEKEEEQENKRRNILNELKEEFPLYQSEPISIYSEKYARFCRYPFGKRAVISKPIHEQLDVAFQ